MTDQPHTAPPPSSDRQPDLIVQQLQSLQRGQRLTVMDGVRVGVGIFIVLPVLLFVVGLFVGAIFMAWGGARESSLLKRRGESSPASTTSQPARTSDLAELRNLVGRPSYEVYGVMGGSGSPRVFQVTDGGLTYEDWVFAQTDGSQIVFRINTVTWRVTSVRKQ